MVNLAINGFGRIGRLFLRALIESKYSNNLKDRQVLVCKELRNGITPISAIEIYFGTKLC